MIGFGSSADAKPLAEHVQVVALYDPASGDIAHLHMVTTLGDAEPLALDLRHAGNNGIARNDHRPHLHLFQ